MTSKTSLRNATVIVIATILYPILVRVIMEAIGPTGSLFLLILVSLAASAVLGLLAPYVLRPRHSKASYLMALAPILLLLLSATQSLISSGAPFIGDYPLPLIGVMALNSTIIIFAAHATRSLARDDA
jgi:hypothetical protein